MITPTTPDPSAARLAAIRAMLDSVVTTDSNRGTDPPTPEQVADVWPRISALTTADVRAVLDSLDAAHARLADYADRLARAEAVARSALALMRSGWFSVEDVMGDAEVDALHAALLAWEGALVDLPAAQEATE